MDKTLSDMQSSYKMLENVSKKSHRISIELVSYLKDNGFFSAPASTIHHGNYSGGLFDHSFGVACKLAQFTDRMGLEWEDNESPFIVGFFHDLCKLGAYKRNIDGWEHSDKDLLPVGGHGYKSVIMLQKFMKLTEQEILCIRWHMGAYETQSWKEFAEAVKRDKNVLYTHMADMLMSHSEGV